MPPPMTSTTKKTKTRVKKIKEQEKGESHILMMMIYSEKKDLIFDSLFKTKIISKSFFFCSAVHKI